MYAICIRPRLSRSTTGLLKFQLVLVLHKKWTGFLVKVNNAKIATRAKREVKIIQKRGGTAIVLLCRAFSLMYQHTLPKLEKLVGLHGPIISTETDTLLSYTASIADAYNAHFGGVEMSKIFCN